MYVHSYIYVSKVTSAANTGGLKSQATESYPKLKALLLGIRATGDLSCTAMVSMFPARFCSHWKLFAIDTQIAIASIGDYQPNRANLLFDSPSGSCRTNLSLYFRCLSLPFSFSFSFLSLSRVQIGCVGIQLSAIWSVEAGQRVSPFTLAIIVVACRHCRCDLKDNESDARDKTILVEKVKDRGRKRGKPSRRDEIVRVDHCVNQLVDGRAKSIVV